MLQKTLRKLSLQLFLCPLLRLAYLLVIFDIEKQRQEVDA